MLSEILKKSRKIVAKIGSNTLANSDGTINKKFLEDFIRQVHLLMEMHKRVIVVSSGAIMAGVSTIKKWKRMKDIHHKQALAAIGQVTLMESYREAMHPYNTHVAQILLTADDFKDDTRTLNIRNTLFTLLDDGVLPIVNENDTISVEEIKLGDNDNLAALTAILWDADLLILFSDIDGIYNKNPREDEDAVFIEEVTDIPNIRTAIQIGQTSSFGTGGIATKIQAAEKVNAYGIPMLLANGKKPNIIGDLLEGKAKATLFIPKTD